MNIIRALISATAVLSGSGGVAFCQDLSQATTLQIEESAGNYVLSVPVSRLVMTIPKGKSNSEGEPSRRLEPIAPDISTSKTKILPLFISGWFESDEGFPGIKQFWANETAAWKRGGLPEARDVAFTQLGDWNAVIYEINSPVGRNSHVRAHWVQAGTWIDIHLSLTADLSQKELREKLQSVLKTISVAERQ